VDSWIALKVECLKTENLQANPYKMETINQIFLSRCTNGASGEIGQHVVRLVAKALRHDIAVVLKQGMLAEIILHYPYFG
jgi:hypothetical protein